jgi:plasmid stabilization system protein ParE
MEVFFSLLALADSAEIRDDIAGNNVEAAIRLVEGSVEIVRVVHAARDFNRLFAD